MIMIISLTAWYFFFAGMTAEIFLGSTTTTQHRWVKATAVGFLWPVFFFWRAK